MQLKYYSDVIGRTRSYYDGDCHYSFCLFINDFIAGALGSSLLVYVLPCLFHLKVCWNDVSRVIKVKDIALIIFGVLGAIIGVYSVIRNTKI